MECVACYTSFLDPLNPPVKQSCNCSSHVCIECRQSVSKCPFCRERTLCTFADIDYVEQVRKMARSLKCEGCKRTVSTRLAREHFASCPEYLRGRILNGREDRVNILGSYHTTCSVNQELRARNFQLQEQLRQFMTVFHEPPPLSPPPIPPPPHEPPQDPPRLPPSLVPPPQALRVGPVRISSSGVSVRAEYRLLHP